VQMPAMNVPGVVGIQHRAELHPYTEDEVRFEIDMCIGCDRCMRACPVPLSSTVNIADLNRATISDDIAPHVARFTQECVMCGSCVSVCPVDNHRDLLMLSLKQRLGVPWDGTVDMSRVLDFLPSGWDAPLMLSRLREQEMFCDPKSVPDNYLLHFIASSKVLTLLPGATLLHEGEYGRAVYFILEGRFELSNTGTGGLEMPIAVLRRGEYLGEQGMLTGQPRDATVRALTAAVVLEAPEQVVQRLMEIVPTVKTLFEDINNARFIETTLRGISLFQGVSEQDIQWIAQQTRVTSYDRDERLFGEDARAGNRPEHEALHLLLDGFVKVARRTVVGTGRDKTDERIIAYRQGGDYFAGGLDLLGDGRPVTVTAITRVRVAETPQDAIHAILSRYSEVNRRYQAHLRQYREAAAAAQTIIAPESQLQRAPDDPDAFISDAEARAGLRSLVAGGVIEGTEVLVIDLDKCVHCNNCEDACARRHGHSRMNRKGMVIGNISVATACRQCQDPVCMLCSRAGIARLPSGEVYITESCIGCGICAERCPYNNISIMTLQEEVEERSVWQHFGDFFTKGVGKERGRRTLPMLQTVAPSPLAEEGDGVHGEIRKKLAIKCDLCAGYNNQACVQACPTGAAFRVQPTQFFGSTEEILRRRAQ
jgi:Fe-S-cluster-containing hydrogenase component 2/CRP-like cAMP-binding protein